MCRESGVLGCTCVVRCIDLPGHRVQPVCAACVSFSAILRVSRLLSSFLAPRSLAQHGRTPSNIPAILRSAMVCCYGALLWFGCRKSAALFSHFFPSQQAILRPPSWQSVGVQREALSLSVRLSVRLPKTLSMAHYTERSA